MNNTEPIDELLEIYIRVHTPINERPSKMSHLRALNAFFHFPPTKYKNVLIQNLEPMRKKWSTVQTFIENTLVGKYEECPICYENMEINNYIFTPCSHIFCVKCLATHLRQKQECPICRNHLQDINLPRRDDDVDDIETNIQPMQIEPRYIDSFAVLYVTYVYLPLVIRVVIIYIYLFFLYILFFTDEVMRHT